MQGIGRRNPTELGQGGRVAHLYPGHQDPDRDHRRERHSKSRGWVDEERNIYEDYKKAFGEEPPMINGVATMSNTDNTKEPATAYYGDIVFRRSVTVSTREP